MDFPNMARRIGRFAIDHSPQILTAVGVAGTVGTAYLAGKAAFKVGRVIGQEEQPYEDDIQVHTPREVVDLIKDRNLWQEFIPAVALGCGTIVCIIMANRISDRRATALAAVVGITERAAEEYRDKVREKFGERKETQVRDEIQQDRVEARYHEGVEVYGPEVGHLCYDKYSDRFFRGTVESIKKAQNDFNYAVIRDGYGGLNEFYEKLGIPAIGSGDLIGWNDAVKMDVIISSTLTATDRPCIAIDFLSEPFPEYHRTFRNNH